MLQVSITKGLSDESATVTASGRNSSCGETYYHCQRVFSCSQSCPQQQATDQMSPDRAVGHASPHTPPGGYR
ncbi:unnamed protein product [Gadus morhua 'NCC']